MFEKASFKTDSCQARNRQVACRSFMPSELSTDNRGFCDMAKESLGMNLSFMTRYCDKRNCILMTAVMTHTCFRRFSMSMLGETERASAA